LHLQVEEHLIRNMLENVKLKITELIAAYETAIEENKNLKSQLSAKDAEIETCREKIQTLNKQINSLELKNAFTSTSVDVEDAKKKIDRMIRELDNCIALMEK